MYIAESCLNCKYRSGRSDKNIICSWHNGAWVSERFICDHYEETNNKNILNSEKKLLEQSEASIRGKYNVK